MTVLIPCPIKDCDLAANPEDLREHLFCEHDEEQLAGVIVTLLATTVGPVAEYGHLMSGGGVNVWPDDPELLEVYPLAKRIEHGKQHGGRVLRRRVIVLDDWEEL